MKLGILRNTARFMMTGALGLLGMTASATTAHAISMNNVRLFTNGDCGGTSTSQFLVNVVGNPGEFPDNDNLVDFGGGVTQWYDQHVFYVVDANGIVIGQYAQLFSTNTGMAGDAFFRINQRPTGTGNFTVYLQDEADSSPDQALGGTYVAGSTQRASVGFNGVALDPDCVPAAGADTTNPVVTVPSNVSVNTGAGLATAIVTFSVSANDDTDGAITPTVTSSPTSGLSSGSAFPVGVTTVTASATDVAGNTGTNSFTVTVTDNENPVLTVPGNIATGTDPGANTAVVTYTAPSATDNVAGVTVARTAGPASGSTFPLGLTTVTHVATDVEGNTHTQSFTVTVTDNEDPVLTVPGNIATGTDPGANTAVVTYTAPSATDNVPGVTIARTVGPASGATFPLGLTTVTHVATDAAGNTHTQTFTVNVADDEDPVLSGPAAIVAVSTGAGLSTSSAVNYTVTAADNVGVTSGPTRTAGLVSGSLFPVGDTVVTHTALDAAGNIGTHTFTVRVTDNENPVLTVPGNIATGTDPGANTAVVTYTAPSATDNVPGVTVARTAGPASGSTFPLGLTTVTHVATDVEGNTHTQSFTVTVTDDEAPVITVPADITTTTDAGLATAAVTFSTSALDNVDGAVTPVITSAPTAGLSSGSAFPIGITTVTATATDAEGNSDSESFTVTVGDDEAPIFTSAQADINVEIDFNLTSAVVTFATPTASDNSGTVTVTQTQGIASGGSFPIGTTVVVFTATDPAGNTETLQFNVNVAIIPPGTVTFVVNSPDDGTVIFTSATAAFNTSVIVTGGTGSSGALQVVPGNYTATYGLPAGFAVTAASCSAASGTINIGTQTAAMSFARGETYICTLSTRDIATQTGRQIQSFMDNRGRLIMANQPNQGRRIARVNGDRNPNTVSMFGNRVNDGFSPFGVAVSQNRVDLSFASSSASEDPLSARAEWDFWFEASVSRYETDFGEGSFAIFHAGADYRISENAILGFGIQLDSAQEDVIGSVATTSGFGWMIGPYYTARIGDGLYFDANLRYGRSDNEISPLGTYTDEFTTERWLASIGLFGSIDRGPLNIQPNISINYFEETSEAYIDSLAVPIAARTTRLGDLEIGSRFTWYDPAGGYSTYFEIEGFYTFEANGQVASLSTVNTGLRGRVGFGGTVLVGPSGSFEYGISYDGIGDDDYEAMTARIGFSVNF